MYLLQTLGLAKQNKYARCYASIITRAKANEDLFIGYSERHHILPKAFKLGGEKDPLNIVKLTAREHFICHLLLARMFQGPHHFSMVNAAICLKGLHVRKETLCYVNSRLYDSLKRELSRLAKTRVFTEQTREKMALSCKRRHELNPMLEETRELLRQKNLAGNNPAALPITIEGVMYPTQQEAKRILGVSLKNLAKIFSGECKTIKEAITRKKPKIEKPMGGNSTKRKKTTFNGEEYLSIRAAAKANGYTYTQFCVKIGK